MKGRLYFTTKAQKEGKIMIKTHPCARIFCCRFCGFDEVGGAGRAAGSTPAPWARQSVAACPCPSPARGIALAAPAGGC